MKSLKVTDLKVNDNLNNEQREAVNHIMGPVMVIAGPGSGKTFLLTERIVNLISSGISSDNILVITFTKKAAEEMESRFIKRCDGVKYPVKFGTFHAVFFHILRFHGIYGSDSIIDERTKYKLIEEAGIVHRIPRCRQIIWQTDMISKITFYKNRGDRLFSEPSFLMDDVMEEEFYKIYNTYLSLCKREGKLDFDDITWECLRLLKSSMEVREYWQSIFKYMLVDEFQDINESQYSVLKLLSSDERNIFVVGDDDQSIYGFRGATPGIMQKFEEDFSNCKRIFLKTNYRSCKEVVAASDVLIRHNKNRFQRNIQSVPVDRRPGNVTAVSFENAREEAEYIVNEIEIMGYEEVAIIYRSEHCVGLLEEMMRNEGIYYDKKSRGISFYDIEIVAIIISYMRIAVGVADRRDLLRILNHPERGLSREALNADNENLFELLINYHDFLGDDYKDRINKLIGDLQMIKSLDPKGALLYLLKGVGLGKDFEKCYIPDRRYPVSLKDLLDELRQRFEGYRSIEELLNYIELSKEENVYLNSQKLSRLPGKNPRVTFITAHASKGLEYQVVFVAGLQENLFPHHKYLDADGIEEERRLFYVAMTRARERLYICGRGTEYGKRVSRFLSETGIEVNK